MGGGSGGGSSSQTTTQNIAPQLQPLFEQTGATVAGLQPQIAGQFGEFFAPQPQQIPGLTPGQQAIQGAQLQRAFGQPLTGWEQAAGGVAGQVGSPTYPEMNALSTLYRGEVQGYGNEELGAINRLWGGDILGGGFNPAEQGALGQINRFAGGEIGQSPATQAAMAAVRTPVLNELAQAGLGNSDAIAAALGGAYAPILAQELATRAQVIPQLANLGQQQRTGTLAATGQLAGIGQAMRSGLLNSAQLGGQLGQQLRGGQATQAQLLSQLGATEAGRQSQLLSEYGQAEERARQVQAEQGQAALADLTRRQQLGTQFTTGILSGFPAITSTNVVGKNSGGGK